MGIDGRRRLVVAVSARASSRHMGWSLPSSLVVLIVVEQGR